MRKFGVSSDTWGKKVVLTEKGKKNSNNEFCKKLINRDRILVDLLTREDDLFQIRDLFEKDYCSFKNPSDSILDIEELRLQIELSRIKRKKATLPDAERLLHCVGEKTLRQHLPPSLLAMLEKEGIALTGVQIAEAAIAVYHTDALRQYRGALAHRNPPKQWVGSEQAIDFVRSLGFSPRVGGRSEEAPRALS